MSSHEAVNTALARVRAGSSEVENQLKLLPDNDTLNTYLTSARYERESEILQSRLCGEILKLSNVLTIIQKSTTQIKEDFEYGDYSLMVDLWKATLQSAETFYHQKSGKDSEDEEGGMVSNKRPAGVLIETNRKRRLRGSPSKSTDSKMRWVRGGLVGIVIPEDNRTMRAPLVIMKNET
eukprot:GHVH01011140.1.p1 GENE.GHVH01011140.1~~GHVH01011140.1.p1  ORF type:complete len:179 (+),score=21.10 GHVH01011140.1:51-587(+)